MNILAADHPARNVTKVGADPLAMADRRDYLARILRVLSSERVDGIMATMDILEDLLAIDGFLREAGAPTLLDGRVLIGSLNRGRPGRQQLGVGRSGDGHDIRRRARNGGWMEPSSCFAWIEREPASLKTMLACARAINDCNARGLPMFLEPLPVTKTEKGYVVVKTADGAGAPGRSGVSALGDSSRYLWLKLPHCENYETVARATTLPILLLGGESAGDPVAVPAPTRLGNGRGTECPRRVGGQKCLVPRR